MEKPKVRALGSVRKHGADRPREVEGPALPYARAFIVQFSADTDPRLKRAAGRVEHLQTGTRRRFASMASLRALMAAMLSGDTVVREMEAGRSRARVARPGDAPAGPGPDAPGP